MQACGFHQLDIPSTPQVVDLKEALKKRKLPVSGNKLVRLTLALLLLWALPRPASSGQL